MLARIHKAGKRTGIVTSTERPIFDRLMRGHPLMPLMQIAVAGGDVTEYKPHPAGLHRAMDLLDITQEDRGSVAYIGDKDTDILAAKNAGIDGVLFFPPQHHTLYDRAALDALQPAAVITDWRKFGAESPK